MVGADYVGDPKAIIISFGKLKNGNMGNISNNSRAHWFSDGAAQTDRENWGKQYAKSHATLIGIERIHAPDELVEVFAKHVKENRPYEMFPDKGNDSANSNSGANGVADASSRGAGNGETSELTDMDYPGADKGYRVTFNSFSVKTGGFTYKYNSKTGFITKKSNQPATGSRISRETKTCVDTTKC